MLADASTRLPPSGPGTPNDRIEQHYARSGLATSLAQCRSSLPETVSTMRTNGTVQGADWPHLKHNTARDPRYYSDARHDDHYARSGLATSLAQCSWRRQLHNLFMVSTAQGAASRITCAVCTVNHPDENRRNHGHRTHYPPLSLTRQFLWCQNQSLGVAYTSQADDRTTNEYRPSHTPSGDGMEKRSARKTHTHTHAYLRDLF